ncbi:MAG TPA: hypothetical protein PL064_12460, partial [Thermogutta sp.]|nr:hypothetical protein [Thermogutta sp.]
LSDRHPKQKGGFLGQAFSGRIELSLIGVKTCSVKMHVLVDTATYPEQPLVVAALRPPAWASAQCA